MANEFIISLDNDQKTELIRCKDCRFSQDGYECDIREFAKDENWFCADAEPKESEQGE